MGTRSNDSENEEAAVYSSKKSCVELRVMYRHAVAFMMGLMHGALDGEAS